MSEVLNANFQKVFTTESGFRNPQGKKRNNEMWKNRINREKIKEMMKELDVRKAVGPECSLKTGKVFKEWKRADIMPIYESGNKEEPLDYRSVSLSSIVYKICEKVIMKQWTDYLEKEGIITDRQLRFRTGRSCVTNLTSFYSTHRYNTST